MRPGLQQRLAHRPRVDWFQVLIDIGRHGFTTQQIADQCAAPKSTILGWKQGGEPNHADGERLVAMWCAVVRLSREQLPMTRCPEWLER